MIRHSLSALLSAPMERVAERVYSYRPNLGGLTPNKDACLEARPAVIEGWDGDDLKIKVLPDLQCAHFSLEDFESNYRTYRSSHPPSNQSPQPGPIDLHNAASEIKKYKRYIKRQNGHTLSDWYVFPYVAAIDACGALNRNFDRPARLHQFVAVPGESFDTIDFMQHCITSLEQIRNDQTGHRADHPLLNKQPDDDSKRALKSEIKASLDRLKKLTNLDIQVELWQAGGSFDAAETQKISNDCIQHYIRSLEQLGNDKTGHLADHPLVNKQPDDASKRALKSEIKASLDRQIKLWQEKSQDLLHQLIFVEIDTSNNEIKSFGHNFLYRWRYSDSVRLHNDEVRIILKPREDEQVAKNAPEHIPPEQLSGARLLCGYTSKRNDKPEHNEGSDNIGKGRYQRLKGRIGCNFAVEYWGNGVQSKDDNERFLPGIDNKDFFIPLKPLGKPRPSAVEHYLRQPQDGQALKTARNGDRAGLRTYGDLKVVDKPGDLAGRKFYLHQPYAAENSSCYAAADHQHIAGDSAKQTSLARFVSQPGTRFRFTLNFNDLRQWEMGALLVTLEPSKHLLSLVEKLAAKDLAAFEPLKKKLKSLSERATQLSPAFESSEGKCGNKKFEKATQSPPSFAHKLGLARPLGFGSVLLNIDEDKTEQIGVDENGLPTPKKITTTEQDKCIAAFAEKLMESANHEALADHLEHWAAIHRYAGLTRAEYPTKRGTPIFKHHSNIRREHMDKRRLKGQGSSNAVDDGALHPETLPEPT